MSMQDFESEVELYMGLLPAKKPWLVEALDCIERSRAPIYVYQRGPNWRGS